MKHVDIYSDGACSGNPGAGGYGTILKYGPHYKELSGGASDTTNNRMELSGAIEGLSALKTECEVTLYTDSKYIVNAINEGWLENWKRKNWIKSDRKPVLNIDLWQKLDALLSKHKVTFVWVKGHNGHPENERCDELAVQQRDKYSMGI